ncbi:MAG: hypothetical protein LUD22_03380 [Coprobacillus sp.]|nr:hypothetical protein [Coprobacillus sp.]
MNISLVYDNKKDYLKEKIDHITNTFLDNGFTLDEDSPEVVVILGGDGTFLKAIHHYLKEDNFDDISFVGLGLGGLNYFYDYKEEDLDLLIKDLLNHKCKKEDYPLLETLCFKQEEQVEDILSINEVRIANPFKIIECGISIDDTFLEDYRGSGLCIATPLGSSGYTRSAGGSLIDPSLYAMELLEVEPVSNRVSNTLRSPLIVDGDKTISLEFSDPINVSYDSYREKLDIDRLEVFLSSKVIHVLKKSSSNYINKVSKDLISNE